MLRKTLYAIVVGTALVIAAWAGSLRSSCAPPKNSDKNQESGQKTEKNCPSIASSLLADIGHFIHDYRDEITASSTAIIAVFTAILGVFTVRLARSTTVAADAASKATKTAQAEFVASHRPKLRIRNIVVNPPRTVDGRELALFAPGHVVSGQFFIANVGGSRADILDGHCTVFWSREGLPMRRPYEGGEDNLQAVGRTLLSGQSTTALFRSDGPIDADVAQTVGRNIVQGFRLYVMGWVTYADRNNDVWRTGFCREFMPTGGFSLSRFFPVNDPDYEHEE
jgi:hypothetical protein